MSSLASCDSDIIPAVVRPRGYSQPIKIFTRVIRDDRDRHDTNLTEIPNLMRELAPKMVRRNPAPILRMDYALCRHAYTLCKVSGAIPHTYKYGVIYNGLHYYSNRAEYRVYMVHVNELYAIVLALNTIQFQKFTQVDDTFLYVSVFDEKIPAYRQLIQSVLYDSASDIAQVAQMRLALSNQLSHHEDERLTFKKDCDHHLSQLEKARKQLEADRKQLEDDIIAFKQSQHIDTTQANIRQLMAQLNADKRELSEAQDKLVEAYAKLNVELHKLAEAQDKLAEAQDKLHAEKIKLAKAHEKLAHDMANFDEFRQQWRDDRNTDLEKYVRELIADVHGSTSYDYIKLKLELHIERARLHAEFGTFTCGICLSVNHTLESFITRCGHIFHLECIQHVHKCPLCRLDL